MIVGIDPGRSGALAFLDGDPPAVTVSFRDLTPADVCEWLANRSPHFAVLEKVNAFPGQGVASTWKFAEHYGGLKWALSALRIPHELVVPNKWQTALSCRSGGDKRITRAKAQELFPTILDMDGKEPRLTRPTHKNADALLIAEYGRRFL